jgi:hypothetical protein
VIEGCARADAATVSVGIQVMIARRLIAGSNTVTTEEPADLMKILMPILVYVRQGTQGMTALSI